jgi:uncharacterized protein YjbI with pentapeptide repeats
MIQAQRAPVRPRVTTVAGAALLLEEEVQRLLDEGQYGCVIIFGDPGSGKTTAVQHLATLFAGDERLQLLDMAVGLAESPVLHSSLLIAACSSTQTIRTLSEQHRYFKNIGAHIFAVYRLAPWSQDDLIEYLLAVHRPLCASVMARVQPKDIPLLQGNPELWRVVLDQLAADSTLPGIREALHRHLEAQLSDSDLLERARSVCLNALVTTTDGLPDSLEKLARPGFGKELLRVLRHPAAQMMLASERIAADLADDGDCDYLARRLPRPLVRAAAGLVRENVRALEHLQRLLAGSPWSHAMALSLLHATGHRELLPARPPRALAGAYLEEIAWAGVDLSGADLTEADLSGADLHGANLSEAIAHTTNLAQASLQAATLTKLKATKIVLTGANLSWAQAEYAALDDADLEGAILTGANLRGATLMGANLAGANCRDAVLRSVCFPGAILTGTCFAGADLARAVLSNLCLREADWLGANFKEAILEGCDLEGVLLPGANFYRANLKGALLTGASMPDANFRFACLVNAGLADVDWERAEWCGADLRGVSFHLGSTRSGLVGSPIACEGSRTGFYTDDYDEQTYKSPEEIRKANLCGADLRGAHFYGVDFYLVDLRGALFTTGLKDFFRSSGAILE